MFKKTVLVGMVATALSAGAAMAQTPAAPASPHTLTGNVGLFSQYIFRGLTQTDRKPALQGGFDYSHASGLYAGTWASNISWLRDATPSSYTSGGSLEWDFYGGFKNTIGKTDFTYDIGLLYYYYPGSIAPSPAIKADTLELYGALGWKWVTVKYSHSLNNKTFGVTDSRGTYYLEANADVPLGGSGLTLNLHYGKQKYDGNNGANNRIFSYNDWKVGVSYALPKDFTIGAFYTDTSSADVAGYGSTTECSASGCGVFPRNISKGTGTIFLKKTF